MNGIALQTFRLPEHCGPARAVASIDPPVVYRDEVIGFLGPTACQVSFSTCPPGAICSSSPASTRTRQWVYYDTRDDGACDHESPVPFWT